MFTENLPRHVEVPPTHAPGATVREALEAVFATSPRARRDELDDTGSLRKHVVIFLNGRQSRDRAAQSDPVATDSELHVTQALSGG